VHGAYSRRTGTTRPQSDQSPNKRRSIQWLWLDRFQTQFEIDLREGGNHRFWTVEIPGMGVLDLLGQYLDVVPPCRLMYTWKWAPEHTESRVTVEFVGLGDQTELRITHSRLRGEVDRNNHTVRWNDCLDRLGARVQ
jgi:uncharacterized protein YndB with AHSA1/START domain